VTNSRIGVAICTYNRAAKLAEILEAVIKTTPEGCRIVVCDDGSTDDTEYVVGSLSHHDFVYLRGQNKGVAHNKNRALVALSGADYLVILEDDLIPQTSGWFETYIRAAELSGIHHFCRVQDKEIPEQVPEFNEAMAKEGLTPIYGPSPRGDFTFLTRKVIRDVGGFNPEFFGAGYAHGEWSNRVAKAGLIPHPANWVDIREGRDVFLQIGDTEGGRWNHSKQRADEERKRNRAVYRRLKATQYIYCPLEIS